MSVRLRSWAPVAALLGGIVLVGRVDDQSRMPLRESLDIGVPAELHGFTSSDIEISEGERAVAGMTDYVMRGYHVAGEDVSAAAFTLYVGYYDSQTQGKTIHSPRNCLPGAGWEALAFEKAVVPLAAGSAVVNRYIIQRADQRALVLYWYQGRGRVEASEYRVKWDLLRDAALRGRSEEALVRVVVPIRESEQASFELAANVARTIIPAVTQSLPSI